MKVYLAGPNAGKSGIWAGVVFRDGVAEVDDTSEGLVLQLARYHSAFPEKSQELVDALKRFGQEGLYVGNSLSKSSTGAEGSGDSSEQSSSATSASNDIGPDASTGSGGTGGVSEGDGHTDARLDISQVIQKACLQLDPENTKLWTATGYPKIQSLYRVNRDDRITPEAVQQHGLSRMQVRQAKQTKGK